MEPINSNIHETLFKSDVLLNDDIDPDINFLNVDKLSDVKNTPVYENLDDLKSVQNGNENNDELSILSLNIRSINKNINELKLFLEKLPIKFSIICLQETWSKSDNSIQNDHIITGYRNFDFPRGYKNRGGGLCIYVDKSIIIKVRKDLSTSEKDVETFFVELINEKAKNVIIGNTYRPPSGKMSVFNNQLDKILKKIKLEGKPAYLSGDYNMNLLDYERNKNVRKYVNKMNESLLLPAINRPTRITRKKATCIDNIFFNYNFEHEIKSGVINEKISDHLPIFVLIKRIPINKLPQKIKYSKRIFTKENVAQFKENMGKTKWDDIINESDTNEAYAKFIDTLTVQYDKLFPLKEYEIKPKRIINKWMTNSLIKSSRKKQTLYNKFLKNRTLANENKYKKYTKIFNQLIIVQKKNYYAKIIIKHQGDLKKTWATMKELISKNKKSSSFPSRMIIDGAESFDKNQIANAFNKFFVEVGPSLAKKIKDPGKSFAHYLSKLEHKFEAKIADESEIKDAFDSLKRDKSAGHDDIHVNVIKPLFYDLLVPLKHIFNLSLSNGIFPNLMKIAKVIPLFKVGDDDNVGNYRPISILPVLSKVLEKIMHTKLYNYFESIQLFYMKQFGFRKKGSTDYGLLNLVQNITEAMDQHKLTLGVFIDLSKAFDTVDHDILVSKLQQYGVVENELKWFKSYLTGRSQYISYDGDKSDVLPITCGVPQGSILGPLLFIIYVNDMASSVPLLNTVMFADDTNLFFTGNDIKHIFQTMNDQLSQIKDWFAANKLSLNVDKTKYTLFCSKSDEENLPLKLPELHIGGTAIDRVRSSKFLGILLDENLTWEKHIQTIESKISKQIGIIWKARKFLTNTSMKSLYFAFVHPYLNYGNIVWGSTYNSKLSKIHRLQKKAIRMITNSPRMAHSQPLMAENKILTVHNINTYQVMCFMYKQTKNDIPTCFADNFTKIEHKYETRFSQNAFYEDDRCGRFSRFNIKNRGPHIWNTFENEIKNSRSIAIFKQKIKNKLLKHI